MTYDIFSGNRLCTVNVSAILLIDNHILFLKGGEQIEGLTMEQEEDLIELLSTERKKGTFDKTFDKTFF